jgi:glycosyltransferase involved in cell wall biosynthesis
MSWETELSILIVSYAFPPSGAVGAKRIAAFCKYLPEFGIRPIVLTVDEASCEKIDASLLSPQQLRIERIQPRMTVLEHYHRRTESRIAARGTSSSSSNNNTRVNGSRLSLALRRHLLALLSFPDTQRGWYRPAVAAAVRAVAKSRMDAVFSSGPPWTSHAVGYAIARRFRLPWIADFRDQWALDPWRRYDYNATGAPAWRKKLDLWTEDRWVRHAALVVCTTNRQRESLLHAHPSRSTDRVITISNGCDRKRENRFCRKHPASGPRILLHTGDLYGDRRIGGFCRALASLVRAGRLSARNATVSLVGWTELEIEHDARNSAPELFRSGMITFHTQVDSKRAQECLNQADVLLIFQGNHPTAIPAKFYEYIQTGKPILALAGDGELKDIVLRTGSGFVVDPDDHLGICLAIEQALQRPARSPEEVDLLAKQFDFLGLTAQLAKNIRAVLR